MDTQTSGNFYLAIVKTVLFLGSETGVVTPRIGRIMRGLHHRLARWISVKQPRQCEDGIWEYPPLGEAIWAVGL